jgi:hypothetical protein
LDQLEEIVRWMIRVGGNRTMDDCHNIIALHLISEPTSSLQVSISINRLFYGGIGSDR